MPRPLALYYTTIRPKIANTNSKATPEGLFHHPTRLNMGLGILDDHHLDHVPGTALLADMIDAEEHQFHGKSNSSHDD